MQPTAPKTLASPIAVPDVDSEQPVRVIPTASVAPLDGPPDGERINSFTIAPKNHDAAFEGSAISSIDGMRERVLGNPLTYAAAAFALGFVMARVLR